jgi:anti-sigma factor RsiW
MIPADVHPEQEELMGLIDGTLSVDQRDRISRHTKECVRCRRMISDLTLIDAGLKHFPREATSEGFTLRVIRRLEGGTFTDAAYRLLVRVSAGAGMAFVAGAVFAVLVATGTISLPAPEGDGGMLGTLEGFAQNALAKLAPLVQESRNVGASTETGRIGVLSLGMVLVILALGAADQLYRRSLSGRQRGS